jgi:Trk K+ transport system NAD-binding subunit
MKALIDVDDVRIAELDPETRLRPGDELLVVSHAATE